MNNIVSMLHNIFNALNELEVKGKQNHTIIIACMNDIERVIKEIEKKEVGNNGNVHAEQ